MRYNSGDYKASTSVLNSGNENKREMDPTAMMSDGAYMAEIWPFTTTNGGDLDLKFGQVLGQFGQRNVGEEREGSGSMGNRKRRDGDDVAMAVSPSIGNGLSDCDGKRLKTTASREDNLDSETEPEANSSKPGKKNTKPVNQSKQDYIHVRARRGQATDSHSLAERARREKISERMRILQDLVPGCNKVIGKASVLDEIINYIQSLQHQVEFLSMKLEAVNTRMDPGIEGFPSKDFVQQAYDTPAVTFGSQATRNYGKDSPPEWLHMQLGGGYERTA